MADWGKSEVARCGIERKLHQSGSTEWFRGLAGLLLGGQVSKSLNFQERNAGTRTIEVEGVESVENVEATRRAGDQAYCFA